MASAVSFSCLAVSRWNLAPSAAALACHSAARAASLRNSALDREAWASARCAIVSLSAAAARVAASAVSPAFTIAVSAAETPLVTWAFCRPTSSPRPRGAPFASAMPYAACSAASEAATAAAAAAACCLMISSCAFAPARASAMPFAAWSKWALGCTSPLLPEGLMVSCCGPVLLQVASSASLPRSYVGKFRHLPEPTPFSAVVARGVYAQVCAAELLHV